MTFDLGKKDTSQGQGHHRGQEGGVEIEDEIDTRVESYDLDEIEGGQIYHHHNDILEYSPVPPPHFIIIPGDLHSDELESLALICSFGNPYNNYDIQPSSIEMGRYPSMEMTSIKEEDENDIEEIASASEVEESEATNSECEDSKKQVAILPSNQERLLDFGQSSVVSDAENDNDDDDDTDFDSEDHVYNLAGILDPNSDQSLAGIVETQMTLAMIAHSGISQSDSSINSHQYSYTYGNQVEYSPTEIKETSLDSRGSSSSLRRPIPIPDPRGRNNFVNCSFDSEEGLPDDNRINGLKPKTKRSMSEDMSSMPNGLRGQLPVAPNRLKKNKLCHGLSLQEDYNNFGPDKAPKVDHHRAGSSVPKKPLLTQRRSLPGDCLFPSSKHKQVRPSSIERRGSQNAERSEPDHETLRMFPRYSSVDKADLVPCSTLANECNEQTLLLSPSEEAEPLFV